METNNQTVTVLGQTGPCNLTFDRRGTGNLLRDLLSSRLIIDKTKSSLKHSPCQDERSESCSICGEVTKCGPFTPQEIGILEEFVLSKRGSDILPSFCVRICSPCSQTLRRLTKLRDEIENISICLWTVIQIRLRSKTIPENDGASIDSLGDMGRSQLSTMRLEIIDIQSDSDTEDQIVDEFLAQTSPKPGNDLSENVAAILPGDKDFIEEACTQEGNSPLELEVTDIESDSESEDGQLPINVKDKSNNAFIPNLDRTPPHQNQIDDLFLSPGKKEGLEEGVAVPGEEIVEVETIEVEVTATPDELEQDCTQKLRCEVCELEYSSEYSLSRHLKTLLHKQNVRSGKLGTNVNIQKNPKTSKLTRDNHRRKIKKLATTRLWKRYKTKCKVCELEYCGEYELNQHLSTLRHKEGANSRKVGPNGEVTFVCSYCQLEFPLLLRLLSHKKACQGKFNHAIAVEIKTDSDQEIKPVVCEMEFDLMETQAVSRDQSPMVEKTFMDNDVVYSRPKRASRLLAERKLLDLTKSKDIDATSDEENSMVQDSSDFEEELAEDNEIVSTLNGDDAVSELKFDNTSLPFVCRQCGRGYVRHDTLVAHERNKKFHQRLQKLAQKSGRSIFSVQRERRRKQPMRKNVSQGIESRIENWFTCKKCGKKFGNKSNWKRHEKDTELHELLEKRAQNLGRDVFQLQQERKQRKTPSVPDPLTCQKCWEHFPDIASKARHELDLAGGKYKCDICDVFYCSVKQRERHFLTALHFWSNKCRSVADNGDVIYTCDKCPQKFDDIKTFSSHKKDVHGKHEFFCEPCNIQLSHYSQFREHLLTDAHARSVGGEEAVWNLENQKKFACDTCHKKYLTSKLLRIHFQTHEKLQGSEFSCEKCGKKFLDSFKLNSHLKTHTEIRAPKIIKKPNRFREKPIQCKKCPKRFLTERLMYTHLKQCGIRVSCEICSKDFVSLDKCKDHKARIHFGARKWKNKHVPMARVICEICSKTMTNRDRWICHMELKHFPDQSSCPYGCSDKIENPLEWKLHLESCTSEKLTEQSKCSCRDCGQIFRTRLLQFEHHLRLHKTYSCQFCSRIFTKSDAIRSHQYEHEEAKAFLCPKCGKRYRTAYNLRLHSTTVCGDDVTAKEETIRKRRELHRIFREKEKPLKCSLCSKGFIEQRRLDAHTRKVHQNEAQDSEEDNETGSEDE